MIDVMKLKMENMLTKAKYLAGVRCTKMMWLQENNLLVARAMEEDEATALQSKYLFESTQWALIEFLKRKFISDDGVEIAYDFLSEEAIKFGLKQTQELIADGSQTIYGAMFEFNQLVVRVDVLQKTMKGWTAYLFKYVNNIKTENIDDVAIVYYVLSR